VLTGDDSLRNHIQRCKGRLGADELSSVAKNYFRVKEDGSGAAGPSISDATGCKKRREEKIAEKAAAFTGSGDMGGSPINNRKRNKT